MPNLGPNQLNVLRRASNQAIVVVFGRLSRHLAKSSWVAASNRYRHDTVDHLEVDYTTNSVQQTALIEYIAASAPLHCADGWSFLARAMDACEHGNSYIAVHLAYYAELRAAMAILATQGIGVFDKRHYVVDSPSSCHLINGRTHVFTWQALEFWAGLPHSGEQLLKILNVGGNTVWSWLTAYQASTTLSATVASSWLRTWGLDLQLLANDQEVRNEASYRPNDVTTTPTFDVVRTSKLLTDFWKLSEPSALSFDLLDRHLLKMAVQRIFKGANPASRIRSAHYRGGLRTMLSALGMNPVESTKMIGFLERSESPLLLKLAEKRSAKAWPGRHLEVLARASLMLRVATGFCAQLISDSTVDRSTLNFWVDAFAETRGLWTPGARPQNLLELWDVIKTALTDEESWMTGRAADSLPVIEWRTGRADTLLPLAQCECVMLWSLFS